MFARFVFALVALCAVIGVAPAQTLTFPHLSGRVVDEAGILDAATRAELAQTLADMEAKSTDQLVVVTLRSLQGTSIEDYGYQLGRHWQIGQKDKDNGALLIVAPNERKVRIEVGYGLEGTLTDAISRFIIETAILPRFRAGDFPGGIRRGVQDIVQVLTGDAEEYKQRAAQAQARDVSREDTLAMLIFLLIAGFIIINVVSGFLRSAGIVKGRRGRRGDFPVIITGGSGGYSGGSSWGGGSSGGGFSGGGGSFGGGGASGGW